MMRFGIAGVVAMAAVAAVAAEREFAVEKAYLEFPVDNDAAVQTLRIVADGKELPGTRIQLCPKEKANWFAPMDVRKWKGKRIKLHFDGTDAQKALDAVRNTDELSPAPDKSLDPWRPQLRYTPSYGWVNDPNGLTKVGGEWRFFHQHNPFGTKWGNMHWGYATSDNLVDWTERGDVLAPDGSGAMFSGCGVVDHANTAGFGAGAHVLVYTAAGKPFTQNLAYSTDGRNYVKCPENPVIGELCEGARDPKVFWHEKTKRWVMALYGTEDGRHVLWIFNSPNLKKWEKTCTVRGGSIAKKERWLYECPGLEEMKIEGENGTAWVIWGADDNYAVGEFDGRVFKQTGKILRGMVRNGAKKPYYGAQTYSGTEDGRVVWVAWYRLPHNNLATISHSFSLPQELTLRRTADGLRLVRRSARELAVLRKGPATSFPAFEGELAEVDVECDVAEGGALELDLRGVKVSYTNGELKVGTDTFKWNLENGRLALKIFVDRVGMEIFSGDGLQMAAVPDAAPIPVKRTLSVMKSEGVSNASFKAYELRGIWKGNGADAAKKTRPDEIFEDFEGEGWGEWTVEGKAFGAGPVDKPLKCQSRVTGQSGKKYVTSYHGMDGAKGTLTSKEFTISRPYLNFRVGGGKCSAEVQLLVDGKRVCAQTGWNNPGDGKGLGEALYPVTFDVRRWMGRKARIRIADNARGGWGHVNADDFRFSDAPFAAPAKPVVREIVIKTKYLLFPMWNCGSGKLRRDVTMLLDGEPYQVAHMLIPEKDPDWWGVMDVSRFKGKTLTLKLDDPPGYNPLEKIVESDETRDAANLYSEDHRPQLKFTSKRGWMNDPNGLAYTPDGKWRLFYQHNPYSVWWGNLHWGYAESTDLLHWTDHGAELKPRSPQKDIISGSGVVDVDNTAGFGAGAHIMLVKYGPGLCVWTAPDGRNYEYWSGNPISRDVPGADPKVIWNRGAKEWVCLTHGVEDNTFVVFICTSKNLKDWKLTGKFYGDHTSKGRRKYMHECPGLEELKIRGEKGTGWILWGANAVSAIGEFKDGKFISAQERIETYNRPLLQDNPTPWYAAQAFQNGPDGRVVLMPWITAHVIQFDKRSPFNQMLGIPQELELVRTTEGLRLSRLPVKEMQALRKGGRMPLCKFRGELAEVDVSCRPGAASSIRWDFRGVPVTWDARTETLTMHEHGKTKSETVKWRLKGGKLEFKLFLDRLGFEIFSPDGLQSAVFKFAYPDKAKNAVTWKTEGEVKDVEFTAYPLKSIFIR